MKNKKDNDCPTVSVVIPTYNRSNIIQDTINSVIQQSYSNLEIIVVDDGSEDNTPQVMSKYKHKCLKYIRLAENRGANAARNMGIKNSTGKYISFLDSDDQYAKNNIQKKVEYLNDLPEEYAGVFTPHKTYKDGKLWHKSRFSGSVVELETIKERNVIGGFSCIAVKKSVFEKTGLLDESLKSAQDYDFYIRLLKKYKIKYIDDTHVDRFSTADRIGFDVERKLQGHKRILKKHGEILSPARKARQYSAIGILFGRQNQSDEAMKYFNKSISTHPYEFRAYVLFLISIFGDVILTKSITFFDKINGLLTKYRA